MAETKTRVVHCKRDRYDVYIGRGSIWGNPFRIGPDGTREEVIQKYTAWVLKQPKLLSELPKLKGKVLGCWCKPLACHGDVLVELVERPFPRMLPTKVIDGKTYFVDERLRQLRNVENPHDYIDLDA